MTYFFLILSIMSCESDDLKTEHEKLPPATQEGENTFGCLVDGKAWVAKSDSWSSPAADAYYQEGWLSITAFNNDIEQVMRLSLYDLNLFETEYVLIEYPDPYGRLNDINNSCLYITSPGYIGVLTITHLDQVKHIISGTFEFKAYSTDCTKAIAITNGRFDLNFAA